MATLSYKDSTGADRNYSLTHRAAIGRHPAQDIQLLDRVVSKEHAILEFREGVFWLYDAGSRNGTYLNGSKIQGRVRLSEGDEITIGSTTMTFAAKSPGGFLERVTVQPEVESGDRHGAQRCSLPQFVFEFCGELHRNVGSLSGLYRLSLPGEQFGDVCEGKATRLFATKLAQNAFGFGQAGSRSGQMPPSRLSGG